jgi:hypothetical protein
MSDKLLTLATAGLVWAVILTDSLGAPYRIVQGLIVLGVVLLALQVPDTIDRVRDIRDRCTKPRPVDDAGGPQT